MLDEENGSNIYKGWERPVVCRWTEIIGQIRRGSKSEDGIFISIWDIGSEGKCRQEQNNSFKSRLDAVCDIKLDGRQLEHISEFNYLGLILAEPGTDWVKSCTRKVAIERGVLGMIRFQIFGLIVM